MADIINLLSSSPEPAWPTKKASVTTPQQLYSKALTSQSSKRKNEDYFTLLSDSIDADSYLPPPKPAPKPSDTNFSTSTKPEASMITTTKSVNKNTEKDFFFLSDDFDSTVNLDESVMDLPFAKKPRLSPPSGSRITKSKGYRNWLDRLEKSGNSSSPLDSGPNISGAKTSGAGVCTSGRFDVPKSFAKSSTISSLNRTNPESSSSNQASSVAPRVSSNKRSISDIGAMSKPVQLRASGAGVQRSKTTGAVLDSDPIIFTSPDPRADVKRRKDAEAKKRKERINAILADSSDSDVFELNTPKKGKKKVDGKVRTVFGNALGDFEFESSDGDLPELGAIPPQASVSKPSKAKATSKEVPMTALEKYEAEKAKVRAKMEKEHQAKDKLAAKEAEKEAKRLAKEEKARENGRAAELAKVNVLRTDKKKSTPEMIVDLPSCFSPKLSEQIQRYLTAVEAMHSSYESSQPIIKWRRKVDAEFDEEAGHWEKVESYIGREKHIMCIITAKEFVDLATGEEGGDLDSHVLRLKAKFATNGIIYLIEGLDPWMKKNKNVRNRKYVEQVRNQMPAEESTASQKRKRKPEPDYMDEDLVEDALLKLQVIHGVLIHHTRAMVETAEWVIVFTQHISTIPYKAPEQDLEAGFCMESGQVKTGDRPADTYAKMLQEMVRITPSVAYGIAAKYPTVQKLVQGLRKEGPLALENCRKTANKDGVFTDKKVGPSISKRVHSVFTCKDPGSWVV